MSVQAGILLDPRKGVLGLRKCSNLCAELPYNVLMVTERGVATLLGLAAAASAVCQTAVRAYYAHGQTFVVWVITQPARRHPASVSNLFSQEQVAVVTGNEK